MLALLLVGATQPPPHASQRAVGKRRSFEEMVDVGGYRLHVRCSGSGSPTVVLEAGAASPSSDWDKVMPGLSRFTRVCGYDRAGVGRSEAAPQPRTGARVAEDLRALLGRIGEPAPYVLVGHSFGGMFGVLYAGLYPKEVAGLVLVDSSHEEQFKRFEALMTPEQLEQSRARRASRPEGVDTTAVRAEVAALRWRADIPLVVLVHGVVTKDMTPPGWSAQQLAERERVWREMQQEMARRSPQGRVIIAEKSGHYIQNDQPDLVIDAVRRVVESVRSRKAGRGRR
jgi:pimeloyl-ACP methyl ester carboxylesterase